MSIFNLPLNPLKAELNCLKEFIYNKYWHSPAILPAVFFADLELARLSGPFFHLALTVAKSKIWSMDRFFIFGLQALLFLVWIASALPFITALGLIIGRRGHAAFCLFGSRKLLGLALGLGIAAFFYFPASFLGVLLPYGAPGQILSSLFEPAALPWLLGSLAWLFALPLLPLARHALKRVGKPAEDFYAFAAIRPAFMLCCAASALFFMAMLLNKWPFAGLPQGLDMERAVMAIMRSSLREFFRALSPAGAVALLYCVWQFATTPRIFREEKAGAFRWFSFWAIAGCAPALLANWGLQLGSMAAGTNNSMPGHAALYFYALVFQSLAVALWSWIIVRPEQKQWRATVALALTLCAWFWPLVLRAA